MQLAEVVVFCQPSLEECPADPPHPLQGLNRSNSSTQACLGGCLGAEDPQLMSTHSHQEGSYHYQDNARLSRKKVIGEVFRTQVCVCIHVYFISKSVIILYNTTQEYILYNIIQR